MALGFFKTLFTRKQQTYTEFALTTCRAETAYEYIRGLPYLPMRPGMKGDAPSNSQIRRWLKEGAVEINGSCLGPDDIVELPVESLVFFPKGKRVTML